MSARASASKPLRSSWLDKLRAARLVFMVDRAGCIHELTPEGYAALSGHALKDSIVCLTRREAEKRAAQRRG